MFLSWKEEDLKYVTLPIKLLYIKSVFAYRQLKYLVYFLCYYDIEKCF